MYVCTYVYILEGHWDARHVRPLTFNTHIFCQFYSMQQHADSIIRVNGSRADGGEGPQGPCYLLQTVMNESRKRRPNSICMFTSSSIVLHPAVFLVHYLMLMSMTSVLAVTTSHTLTRTSHSVVVPFTRITFPAFNVFEAHAHSKQKKTRMA